VEINARMLTFRGRLTFVAVVRDITERKRAEEERRKLETQFQQMQKLESLGLWRRHRARFQ